MDRIIDNLLEEIPSEAVEEAKKRAKGLLLGKRLIYCLGRKRLESWVMANYIYFLNRSEPFTSIDSVHVYVRDDEVVLTLHSRLNKKRLEGDYIFLEHLLLLQDVMNVYIELDVRDEKIKRKAVNTFKTIEKFPAKKGEVKAKWTWNEEVEPLIAPLLRKKVKEILAKIREKAIRLGCLR